MQTFTQTFAGAQTWVMNIPGAYFVTLQCTNPINVRLFKGGKKLDLGDMTGLLAGLEIGPLVEPGQIGYKFAFDRVEIDVTGADTIKIGIGNGAARYARLNGSMDLLTIQPAAAAIIQRPETPSANYALSTALTANTAVNIFTPASNTNGAIVLSAQISQYANTGLTAVLIAKSSAPANITDGQIILQTKLINAVASDIYFAEILPKEQAIAAGLGLYLISSGNTIANWASLVSCRYKII